MQRVALGDLQAERNAAGNRLGEYRRYAPSIEVPAQRSGIHVTGERPNRKAGARVRRGR